jgi:hypothetical protein
MFSVRLSRLLAYTFLGANGNSRTSVSLNRVKQLPPAEKRQGKRSETCQPWKELFLELPALYIYITPAFSHVMFSGRLSSLQAYTFLGANGNCGTSGSLNRVKQHTPGRGTTNRPSGTCQLWKEFLIFNNRDVTPLPPLAASRPHSVSPVYRPTPF